MLLFLISNDSVQCSTNVSHPNVVVKVDRKCDTSLDVINKASMIWIEKEDFLIQKATYTFR